jgi:hypothetical protein
MLATLLTARLWDCVIRLRGHLVQGPVASTNPMESMIEIVRDHAGRLSADLAASESSQ